MSLPIITFPEGRDVRPTLAIALHVSSTGGLAVQYTGIRRFDLTTCSIADVVKDLSDAEFRWKKPSFGKMNTALTINVDKPTTALIFVLDPSLDAEFSNSLPPFFASDMRSARALCNPTLWPACSETRGAVHIASVITNMDAVKEPGDIAFNIALDNVGVTAIDGQPYRTPIIIDPDFPHPPAHGGVGGGGPP